MNKTVFADRAVRLLSGKTRAAVTAAALALLLVAAGTGTFLANRVLRAKDEILNSRLVQNLTSPSEQKRIAALLTNPEDTELLLNYIDSLAGAIGNMEVSRKWRFSHFAALLDGARENGVTIVGFDCGEEGNPLSVLCAGEPPPAFLEALERSGQFVRVEPIAADGGAKEFTINCYIS